MRNKRTVSKNRRRAARVLQGLIGLFLTIGSSHTLYATANNPDSLLTVYANRLTTRLEGLIRQNAQNDAAGRSAENRYLLQFNEAMEDIDDPTGFLRQPERPDYGGGYQSFLGNEVNAAKLQSFENELVAINASCNTHKSYLVLIGTILVEVNRELRDTQWLSVSRFFEGAGINKSAIEDQYRRELAQRQGFYRRMLDSVRMNIRMQDNSPLVLYNMYAYRVVSAKRSSKVFAYLHMDAYGNFEDRETLYAIKGINFKRFNWQSKYRSDFVQSGLGLIRKNNEDYAQVNQFFEVGLSSKIEQWYSQLLSARSGNQESAQTLVFEQHNLYYALLTLHEAAFGKLTLPQRLKLIGILSYGSRLSNDHEQALLYLIRTTPQADAAAVFDALRSVNPLRIDGGILLYGLVNVLEDETDYPFVGGLLRGDGNNNLTGLMKALKDLYDSGLPEVRKETLLTELEAQKDNRSIVWDYSWTDTRIMQFAAEKGAQPVGAMTYEVVLEKNGTIRLARKTLEGITWYRMPGNDGDPGRPFARYSDPATITISDPLALVVFENRTDLGIVIPTGKVNEGGGSKPDHIAEAVPAIFLYYAMKKQLNKIAEDRLGHALTVLNVLVPYTRLLNIVKSAAVTQRVFAGAQLLSSGASATKLATLATPLAGDTTLGKVLSALEMTGIINIFNLNAGSRAIRSITNIDNAAATMGKYIASIEGDAMAYNRLYDLAYGAANSNVSQKAAAQLLIHVKDEILYKGEAVFGTGFWRKYIGLPAYLDAAGTNKDLLQLFTQTGLYNIRVADEGTGMFRVMSRSGNTVLAEVDAAGVVALKEPATLTNDLRQVNTLRVKYKQPGSTVVNEEVLLAARRADNSSCLIAGYCFAAGTPVAIPGGQKPIEEIQTGDTVITKDMVADKNTLRRVTALTKKVTTKLIRLVTGKESIVTTPEHPFYIAQKGWTLAGKLAKGARIVTLSGAMTLLTSVQAFDSAATVYNFEVPETHNYYVGHSGLLAHNTEGCKRLTALMAGRLGSSYDEMAVVIQDIASRYKTLSGFSEEAALAKLEQLCSEAITKSELQNFLSNLKANSALKEKFVGDLVKYDDLLGDFANNGNALDMWVQVRNNPGKYFEVYSEAVNLGNSFDNWLKSRLWAALRSDAKSYESVAANYLKTITSRLAEQVHLDVEYLNAAGVLVKERVILDGLYKDLSTGKWVFTDAKYTTVNDFITRADYLASCTANQKGFYEALINNKVQKIISRSNNAENIFINEFKIGKILTTSEVEFRILPSIKEVKQVNVSKIKSIQNL
jgi:hypothetical protein